MTVSKLATLTEPTVLEFLETAAHLERRMDRALSIRGISFSEYRLLTTLANVAGEGSSRIDLSMAVGLTPSAVTRALKPLEKLGYVTTIRNARDARQSLASITAQGTRLLGEAQSVLHDLLRTLPLNGLAQQKVTEFRTRLRDVR